MIGRQSQDYIRIHVLPAFSLDLEAFPLNVDHLSHLIARPCLVFAPTRYASLPVGQVPRM
jgi:hypothetical protein